MAQEKQNRFKRIIQTVALLLLLVGLPLGSWYYLQQGLDYRLSVMEEMDDLGSLPAFTCRTVQDSVLRSADLHGKVVVGSLLSALVTGADQEIGEVFRKLHQQFGERPDVALLLFGMDPAAHDKAAMLNFAVAHELADQAQCYLLPAGQEDMSQWAENVYAAWPESQATGPAEPVLFLVDTSLTIRKFYHPTQEEEVKRLIEHIALILPRQPDRDIVFKREKEK